MAEQPTAKRYLKTKTAGVIIGIVLLAMIVVVIVAVWPENNTSPQPTARVAETVKAEEFSLIVGKEVPTVEVGSGTRHRLWSNKPYTAVSVQLDGSRILYDMPAGWESWTGAEPMGRLRLIGKKEGTIVRI